MNLRISGEPSSLELGVRGAVYALLLLAAIDSSTWAAAPIEAPLDARLDSFEARSGWEFVTLCKDVLKMPCGMEEASLAGLQQEKGAPLHVVASNARAVLDAIIERYPTYRWVDRGGVVNLEPKIPGEDLLSRKLGRVSIHGISSFQAARTVLDQAKIPYAYQPKGGRYGAIDLELKDVTVREALNAIVRIDGQVLWIFSHSAKDSGLRFKGTLMMRSWRKQGIGPHGRAPK